MSGTSIFDSDSAAEASNTFFGNSGGNAAGLMGSSNYGQLGAQGINPAQQWHAQQQMQYNQALMAQQMQTRQHQWMINGKTMDFTEFLDTICPEEDDPMRTFLTLKYKGVK